MLEQMRKDFKDFCNECDRFIQKQKAIHEVRVCDRCGMVIDPDERMIEADGLPYHLECFKEIMD